METGELMCFVLPACATHSVAHCLRVPDRVLHTNVTLLDAHCHQDMFLCSRSGLPSIFFFAWVLSMTVNCFHVRLSRVIHCGRHSCSPLRCKRGWRRQGEGVSGDSLAMLSAREMEEPDLPEVSNPSTSRRHELLSWMHRRRHDRAQADVGWPPHLVDSLDAGGLRDDSTLRRPRQVPNEQRDEARASPGFCEEEHVHTTSCAGTASEVCGHWSSVCGRWNRWPWATTSNSL